MPALAFAQLFFTVQKDMLFQGGNPVEGKNRL
jgi:hypothetical protein